jgi:hypothetical protein
MASHSCAFRFRGAESLVHISSIIAQGRASLEAAIAAGVFLVASCLSFSFFVLFSACAPSTTIPFVPAVGAVLYLQIVLPSIGMTMAMNNGNAEAMKRVPEKNDQSVIFSRNEGWRMYQMIVLKAIPPALLPQLLHFIAFGELVMHFDPDLVSSGCPGATSWVDVVRCDALKDYSGVARTSSGVLVLAEFVFCTLLFRRPAFQFVSIRREAIRMGLGRDFHNNFDVHICRVGSRKGYRWRLALVLVPAGGDNALDLSGLERVIQASRSEACKAF